MEFFKGASSIYYLVGVLAGAIALETLVPWRRVRRVDPARWLRNASMLFYSIIILGLLPAISGFGAALAAESRGFGLLNAVPLAYWAELALAFVAFDVFAFVEHRFLHKWYPLWRTHRVHHSDRHIDATTSLRFHPMENIFRACFEAPLIALLGLPPDGVLFAFAIHTVINTLTHCNFRLPLSLERALSLLIITPRMHRLHHSAAPDHQFANFGTAFSLWDRLAGSFRAPEQLGDDERFGIDGPEQIAADTFANLALDPFRRPRDGAIPRPDRTPARKSDRVAEPGP